MLNLDTHMLVFAVGGALRPVERTLLVRARWSISAVVLWELAKLVQLGRVNMDLDDRDVARVLNQLHVWPIDLEVAKTSVRLDFRGTRRTRSSPPPVSCTTSPCSPVNASSNSPGSSPWPRRTAKTNHGGKPDTARSSRLALARDRNEPQERQHGASHS